MPSQPEVLPTINTSPTPPETTSQAEVLTTSLLENLSQEIIPSSEPQTSVPIPSNAQVEPINTAIQIPILANTQVESISTSEQEPIPSDHQTTQSESIDPNHSFISGSEHEQSTNPQNTETDVGIPSMPPSNTDLLHTTLQIEPKSDLVKQFMELIEEELERESNQDTQQPEPIVDIQDKSTLDKSDQVNQLMGNNTQNLEIQQIKEEFEPNQIKHFIEQALNEPEQTEDDELEQNMPEIIQDTDDDYVEPQGNKVPTYIPAEVLRGTIGSVMVI
jgi:hypothetical protein